jgi:transposase-like protein
MNLIDVAQQFATAESCNDFLEKMRWPDGITCLACESKRVSKYVKQASVRKSGARKGQPVPARILYVCLECGKQFSVTEGTIFNDSHLSLEKWFMAAALMVNAKKGISAKQMQRDLGVAYKTAWYLSHRIREAMIGSAPAVFEGVVEADATFVGGKYDPRRQRAKYGKQPVFGLLQRRTKGQHSKIHAEPVPIESRQVVTGVIEDRVSKSATVYTDEGAAYRSLRTTGRKHAIVIHSRGEYVNGQVHNNGVENFWSLFKRGLIGSFHKVSVKHLQRYLAEFTYRFNNREEENLWAPVIAALLIGSTLPYAKLIEPLEGERGNGPEVTLEDEPL